MTEGLGGLRLPHLVQLVGGGLDQGTQLVRRQVFDALARLVHDGGAQLVFVEALGGGQLDEPLAHRLDAAVVAAAGLGLAGPAVGPGSGPGQALGWNALRARCARRGLVAVEAVAELDAEAAERPLHAVRYGPFHRRVVSVEGVLGHRVDAEVGAGQSA